MQAGRRESKQNPAAFQEISDPLGQLLDVFDHVYGGVPVHVHGHDQGSGHDHDHDHDHGFDGTL
jgi:hypothetical protein